MNDEFCCYTHLKQKERYKCSISQASAKISTKHAKLYYFVFGGGPPPLPTKHWVTEVFCVDCCAEWENTKKKHRCFVHTQT